mgnify:FL=1
MLLFADGLCAHLWDHFCFLHRREWFDGFDLATSCGVFPPLRSSSRLFLNAFVSLTRGAFFFGRLWFLRCLSLPLR